MAALDNNQPSSIYSWSEPTLRKQAPSSLKLAGPLRGQFTLETHTKKPEQLRGSMTVSRDKPFPELKPKYSNRVKKLSFDQEWLKEHREAKLREFKVAREHTALRKSLSEPLLGK